MIYPVTWRCNPSLAVFRVGMYHVRMSDTLAGQLVAEVIAEAAVHGFTVTESQLVRWHREGLLPPIGQAIPRRFLGRGRGSETVYPPGTGGQVTALCHALAENRKLSRAGWQLWWRGYTVAPSFGRDPLEAALKELEDLLAFVRCNEGLSDKMIDQLTARSPLPLPGKIKRRVGVVAFRRIVRVVIRVLEGTFTDWNDEDRFAVERGVRIDEARETTIPVMRALVSHSIVGLVLDMARWLNVRRLREILEAATDDDFATARDEIRATFTAVDSVLRMLELFLSAGGFLRALLPSHDTVGADDQPLFLLMWLAMRRAPGFSDGFQKIMESVAQIAAVHELVAELPPNFPRQALTRGVRKQLRTLQ